MLRRRFFIKMSAGTDALVAPGDLGLLASLFYLKSSGAADNDLVRRTRAGLNT